MTRQAYLLFYRRRTPTPLGPPELQAIVKNAESENTRDSDAEDDETDRSRPRESDSGNGQRLDASSRNGSSSAFTAGTGVAAGAAVLRGGGSQLSRGSLLKNGVAAESQSDDEYGLPPYANNDGANDEDDEGFVDADETTDLIDDMYAPLHAYSYDEPIWSFQNVNTSSLNNQQSDDAASDMPNLGSEGGEQLQDRIAMDFADDEEMHPGASTPVESLLADDGVHEIRVAGE